MLKLIKKRMKYLSKFYIDKYYKFYTDKYKNVIEIIFLDILG